MAAHIAVTDANAWLEATKLSLSTIDAELESQVSLQIFARLAPVFNTASWADVNTTPKLVKSIVAMYYTAAIYDRAYSDDSDTSSNYAATLRGLADANIAGLLSGTLVLTEDPAANSDSGKPVFFPNDLSSANAATVDNPSDGGPAFTMGSVF
jgi:hypothetical protein